MPTQVPLLVYEDNDEIIDLTITAEPGDDLTVVTGLEMIIKPEQCGPDSGDDTTILSTAGQGITITTKTAGQIVAVAVIPAAALAAPYPRVWRVDCLIGGLRRTAVFGPMTVVDL